MAKQILLNPTNGKAKGHKNYIQRNQSRQTRSWPISSIHRCMAQLEERSSSQSHPSEMITMVLLPTGIVNAICGAKDTTCPQHLNRLHSLRAYRPLHRLSICMEELMPMTPSTTRQSCRNEAHPSQLVVLPHKIVIILLATTYTPMTRVCR